MQIDKEAFEFAIAKIEDGFIFERFSSEFLAAVLGYEFIPVGRTKDKGVDAFQHVFSKKDNAKIIFQMSTELGHVAKIYDTAKKLDDNEIAYSRLFYITNRNINNSDKLIDDFFEKTEKQLTIFDIKWFSLHCNTNQQTINAYRIFVDTYLHEYSIPGKYVSVANLDNDSRLYVFLEQQFDTNRSDLKLDNLLVDTLILYALEGTDPDKHIFRTEAEIEDSIAKYIKFDPTLIREKLKNRLTKLTTKPRKIKFHSVGKGYCLPFETRTEIEERNLLDESLFKKFYEQTEIVIKKYFKDITVKVQDIEVLIRKVFNSIFLKQGLEFSNFVLSGDSQSVIEQNLNDVIALAVDESAVVVPNKQKVKTALHLAIRDIVYNGTPEQARFLKSLSNTYLMMYLLQWEPKLTTYFHSLASQLKVFVDNSVILPALSEYYLPDGNRRHWNLLIGAKKAGISMFINETLLDELVSHFRMVLYKYTYLFQNQENFYLNDDFELLYIDEILIRAYFYAKSKGLVNDFNAFLDTFISPDLKNIKEDVIVYLKDIFGITYISNQAWDIKIDEDEKERIVEKLKKNFDVKAKNDAEMILSIYYLREKDNEASNSGIFGYKTWWLSKDTSTYKAIIRAFGKDKFPVSCYIRPDFIYNYIAFMPSSSEVNDAYNEIFPTMLGVNLSYHMPKEISTTVQEKLKQYHDKPAVRVKQIIKTLTDKLKTDPTSNNKATVELFLDEELKNIQVNE